MAYILWPRNKQLVCMEVQQILDGEGWCLKKTEMSHGISDDFTPAVWMLSEA